MYIYTYIHIYIYIHTRIYIYIYTPLFAFFWSYLMELLLDLELANLTIFSFSSAKKTNNTLNLFL